jgi:hypothetical protein
MADEIKALYDSADAIPETVQFRDLFTEKNGKWELTGIPGIKTQADIDRISDGLRKEREDHGKAKTALSQLKTSIGAWSDLKPEEITAKIDGYDALELAAKGANTVNAEEIEKRVKAELNRHTAPLERKITDLTTGLTTATEQITGYQSAERQRKIHDAVRAARIKAKVLDTAEEDALYLAERMFDVGEDGRITTKDNVGVTPGVEPDVWLTEMQPKRPHWWPTSVGGGAGGGKSNGNTGGPNPWSQKGWNVTQQGAYLREHGIEKATQMASLAGVKLGAIAPAKAS